MSFLDELQEMPWQIIDNIEFFNGTLEIIITFRSGNRLQATSPDKNAYEAFKKEAMLRKISHHDN